MKNVELDEEQFEMILRAIAKMIYIDKEENKEKWKELFFELSNKSDK